MNSDDRSADRQSGHSDKALRVVKVEGRRGLNDFIRLPWSLYADDPMWIPPCCLNGECIYRPKIPILNMQNFVAG